MHQTFYIDIDEEITSVVERLRKAKATEIIMVVPKRALLIQSIVNLRLLKKEVSNLGLQLMIVTQDKLGKLLVEKAGILVQQKLDDSLGEEIVPTEGSGGVAGDKEAGFSPVPENIALGEKNKSRLDMLGSENYFDERKNFSSSIGASAANQQSAKVPKEDREKSENEKIVNKELVTGIVSDIKRKPETDSIKARVNDNLPDNRQTRATGGSFDASSMLARERAANQFSRVNPNAGQIVNEENGTDVKEKKLEKFFYHKDFLSEKNGEEKAKEADVHGSGINYWEVGAWILGLFILGTVLVAGYFFIPKANISLSVASKFTESDCEARGDVKAASVNLEESVIPAKMLAVTEEVSQTFKSSGSKSVSNQKARGKVVIYNEYSSSPQPLVATTRFLTEDGKLFRLIKGVTVPGVAKEGEETKPGTVEAEVSADEAGEEYNISPAKFSIPGFKDSGSEKYQKIYAKSSSPMTGGGSGKDEAKIITEEDISRAKVKINEEINKKIIGKIKAVAGEDMVVSEEAISKEEATYKVSNSAGEMVDDFEITANINASALIFSEEDLKKVVGRILAKSKGGGISFDNNSIQLEYGKMDPDFKAGFINIKVHGLGKVNPDIDVEEFKNNILGRSNEEFEVILNDYPDISKAEVTYWPPFVSQGIPRYGKRVGIEVKEE